MSRRSDPLNVFSLFTSLISGLNAIFLLFGLICFSLFISCVINANNLSKQEEIIEFKKQVVSKSGYVTNLGGKKTYRITLKQFSDDLFFIPKKTNLQEIACQLKEKDTISIGLSRKEILRLTNECLLSTDQLPKYVEVAHLEKCGDSFFNLNGMGKWKLNLLVFLSFVFAASGLILIFKSIKGIRKSLKEYHTSGS